MQERKQNFLKVGKIVIFMLPCFLFMLQVYRATESLSNKTLRGIALVLGFLTYCYTAVFIVGIGIVIPTIMADNYVYQSKTSKIIECIEISAMFFSFAMIFESVYWGVILDRIDLLIQGAIASGVALFICLLLFVQYRKVKRKK